MAHELHTLVTALLPSTCRVRLTGVTVEGASVRLQLTATAPTAACPCCAVSSSSIHGRYQRYLTDLPWGTRAVYLQLTVRKFLWRRFAVGQPVRALTTPVLDWCCEPLAARGMRALLRVWDNASWHTSQRVHTWIRVDNRQVNQRGCGVRVLPCRLPRKRPWLHPIAPPWVHGKRAGMEPVRLVPA
jgi:hypothetical protein